MPSVIQHQDQDGDFTVFTISLPTKVSFPLKMFLRNPHKLYIWFISL